MSVKIARLPGISFAVSFMLVLAACQAVTETQEPIDWKLSWQPTTTHQDNTPLTVPPTYEVEVATGDGEQGPWKVVWTGAATTALIKAPPGRRCFRVVTVESGTRSKPSQINCATKRAEN